MRNRPSRPGLICVLLLLLLAQGAAGDTFNHQNWDNLLRQYVVVSDKGSVTTFDYAALRSRQAEFDRYLAELSAVTEARFDSWPKPAQLAFLLNAYNAWTVKLVLSGDPDIESIKDLGTWLYSPWQKAFIPLLGETRSLDDLEHGLIRGSGRYNDPRIHFAVNCASIGCPALRAEAYSEERVNDQLEEQTRLFLMDRSRNRLERDTLKISPLFDWYHEDFERGWMGFYSVADFLADYAPSLGLNPADQLRLRGGSLKIDYMDYDWRLNRAAQ